MISGIMETIKTKYMPDNRKESAVYVGDACGAQVAAACVGTLGYCQSFCMLIDSEGGNSSFEAAKVFLADIMQSM